MKEALKKLADKMHQADPEAGFAFEFWDGDRVCYGDLSRSSAVTLRFKSAETAKDVLTDGFPGFGEAYMAGDLEVAGDLKELLRLGFCIGFDQLPPSPWKRFLFWLHRTARRNTRHHACQNAAHHYDRGADFYSLYLDPTLTYSCAYFRNSDDSLEQAQHQKYEHIARKLLLKPGERLLDIGCGWGGMLIHAVRNFGVTAVGNTVSHAQYEHVRSRIRDLGLQDQIELLCEDYRKLAGKYDKIVSIGMFEHVGKGFIPAFMRKVDQLLNRGGLGLLHTIGKDRASGSDPWIWKYVFPGNYLPTLAEIVREMGTVGFSVLDIENLRLHYACTLDRWAESFERNGGQVLERFDEVFFRMWRLYLRGAAAGFRYGELRVFQVLFSKGLNNDLPLTRDHVYCR